MDPARCGLPPLSVPGTRSCLNRRRPQTPDPPARQAQLPPHTGRTMPTGVRNGLMKGQRRISPYLQTSASEHHIVAEGVTSPAIESFPFPPTVRRTYRVLSLVLCMSRARAPQRHITPLMCEVRDNTRKIQSQCPDRENARETKRSPTRELPLSRSADARVGRRQCPLHTKTPPAQMDRRVCSFVFCKRPGISYPPHYCLRRSRL